MKFYEEGRKAGWLFSPHKMRAFFIWHRNQDEKLNHLHG